MGKNKHSLSAQEKQIPDLLKCFICQGEKCEALKSSPLNNLAKSGTLSQNICEFSKISEMPISLIHACSITQNFKELKRDFSLPDVQCIIFKIYKKCSTVPAETLSSDCFLCENQASRAEFHEAMTMQLINASSVCTELSRSETFSKIKRRRCVAKDLKYHRACLTSLYNKERSQLRTLRRRRQW